MKHGAAFTLIELLIVVAIIAILAAIAVPNFLEAQIRAKVSRTLADMRTYATALESYYTDNNHYPPDSRDMGPDNGGIDFTFWFMPELSLTTPIAYVTSYFRDPFWQDGPDRYFQYGSIRSGWIIASCGPDKDSVDRGDIKERLHYLQAGPSTPDLIHRMYDSTNGTVSEGDVMRLKQ